MAWVVGAQALFQGADPFVKGRVPFISVNQGSDDGTHMVSGGLLYAENSKTSSSRGTKRVSEIIDNANANSKKEPTLEDFQNAVVVYTFEENVMYSTKMRPCNGDWNKREILM